MLDIQSLRNDLGQVASRLATRGVTFDTDAFRALEDERKALQSRTQELQAKRNGLSKLIGQLKAKNENTAAVMEEVAGLGDALKDSEAQLNRLLERFNAFVALIPNLPHASVPVGRSEADNVEVSRWGMPGVSTSRSRTTSMSAPPWAASTSRRRPRSPAAASR